MEIKRLRTLLIEIFKTINNLNPIYMREIFKTPVNSTHRNFNLHVYNHRTVRYGDKSLRVLGPHIWNSLPENVKLEKCFAKFKNYLKSWLGPHCRCNLCK